MNEYELTVLYHPDLEIDLDKALKKVEKIIKDAGGKITATDNWGKRKLAYTIKKEDHAIYVYYEVELPGDKISKVEKPLNITEEVLRYLLVKPGPEIEEEEEKEEAKDNKKEEAKKNDEEAKEKDDEPKNDEETKED